MVEVGEGDARTSTILHHPSLPFTILPFVVKFRPMPDESPVLPPSRMARWLAIAAVIAFTVALYFRDGPQVPPLTGTPAATGQPAKQQKASQNPHRADLRPSEICPRRLSGRQRNSVAQRAAARNPTDGK